MDGYSPGEVISAIQAMVTYTVAKITSSSIEEFSENWDMVATMQASRPLRVAKMSIADPRFPGIVSQAGRNLSWAAQPQSCAAGKTKLGGVDI